MALQSLRRDKGHGSRSGTENVVPIRPMQEAWHYSRYSDQPMPLTTHLTSMAGVLLVTLTLLAGGLFTWRSYTVRQAQPELAMFNVAPPAAPPAPVRDVPPGPEKVEKKQAEPDRPKIEPPRVEVPAVPSQPRMPKAAPDPAPPVRETTAPESKPAPPAPQISSDKVTWQGLVLAALNKVKRYPRDALFARQQGVPYIRFVMDRRGRILSTQLERSSGIRSLDQEAMALPRRAQPLPKPPEDMAGDSIELVVPVEFFLR